LILKEELRLRVTEMMLMFVPKKEEIIGDRTGDDCIMRLFIAFTIS
jgi:hypothetical protein